MPKKLCAENAYIHELNMQAKLHYHHLQQQQITIAKKKKDAFERINTLLLTRRDLRLGVHFLANGPVWREEQSNLRLWPHYQICALRGVDLTHYSSGKYIKELQQVLPELKVSGWDREKKLCRAIYHDGITEEARKALEPDNDEKRIYAYDFLVCNEKKEKEHDKKICEELNTTKSAYPQLDVMKKYLHDLSLSLFLGLRKKNGLKTLELASTLNDDGEQARIVRAMMDEMKPYYPPTGSDNHLLARLYSPHFGNVKSLLRRSYFDGCYEADLQNAHFSFLAMKYPHIMKKTSAWLKTNESIWTVIMQSMGIPYDNRNKAKNLIKPHTYAIQYGMNSEYSQKKLHEELKKNTITYTSSFLECIYISELAKATQQCLQDIEEKKGMEGPFGFVVWDTTTKKESFMANIFQSYEIALRYPCYELALKQKEAMHSTFKILLDQHDGFTTLFLPGKEKEGKQQLQKIVEKTAKQYNIETRLTFK